MEISELENKLSCIWDLGGGDIPPWAVPTLHREVIYQSVRGKQIALTRERINELFSSDIVSLQTSEMSRAEILAVHQKRALDYVELLRHNNSLLSCATVTEIHSLLFTGSADSKRAKFRDKNFQIVNDLETPVNFVRVQPCMREYDSWLKARQRGVVKLCGLSDILEFAVEAHLRLVYIHPFPDGNGRTARVFLNAILRRSRLPYVALPKVRNSEAVKLAIQQGLVGNVQPFREMLEELLFESCDLIVHCQAKSAKGEAPS